MAAFTPPPPAQMPPDHATRNRAASRWLPACMVVVGGMLAILASLVPWVRVAYPAIDGEPASTVVDSPGRDLLVALAPNRLGPSLIIQTLILWGVPLALAALGTAALVRHGHLPVPRRIEITALLLAVVGATGTILEAVLLYSLFGSLSVIRGTHALEYGPGMALLGYLTALVGLVWLAVLSRATRQRSLVV
jgi:hypothetical protein